MRPGDATAMRRVGLQLDGVIADWGLARRGMQDLRRAVTQLLDHGRHAGPQTLRAVSCAMRASRSIDPKALPLHDQKPRNGAEGVAVAFDLSLRQWALLIELRFAALAETTDELRSHLDHALERLEACIGEAEIGYGPTPAVREVLREAMEGKP